MRSRSRGWWLLMMLFPFTPSPKSDFASSSETTSGKIEGRTSDRTKSFVYYTFRFPAKSHLIVVFSVDPEQNIVVILNATHDRTPLWSTSASNSPRYTRYKVGFAHSGWRKSSPASSPPCEAANHSDEYLQLLLFIEFESNSPRSDPNGSCLRFIPLHPIRTESIPRFRERSYPVQSCYPNWIALQAFRSFGTANPDSVECVKPTLLKIQNKKRWPSREKRQKDRFHHPKECLEAANRRSKLDWTERKGVWEALNTREKGMQTNRINFEDGTKQSALLIETLKLLLNLIDTAFAFIHIHGLNKIYSRNRHHFDYHWFRFDRKSPA